VASLSATVLFEFARWAFNWYVVFAHETLTLYGVLDGLMFFFFWLYYASLVFVLGAETGFAYEQTRLPADLVLWFISSLTYFEIRQRICNELPDDFSSC
jgi:uncharacterized BrkB/YihY/UPF0761 family membrane protein